MQVQKNLPRKKRRKLEAAREMLEDNEGEEDEEEDERRGRSRVSVSVIHIYQSLADTVKHCIDYECEFCFSGERQEEERGDREERIDASGSWLPSSKGRESEAESN